MVEGLLASVAAMAACCLLSPSMMQENAAKVTQLWNIACGAPGKLKASPVQQPATPALIISSFPRNLLSKHRIKLWTPDSAAKVLAEDPALLSEPFIPLLVSKPCPGEKVIQVL